MRDVARRFLVDFRLFMQGTGYAPDHSTHELAACRARIHDAPGSKCADDARDANFAGARVDADLDKFCTEGELDLVALVPTDHRRLALVELRHRRFRRARRHEFGIFLDRAGAGRPKQVDRRRL
jgi:hypothetical protein